MPTIKTGGVVGSKVGCVPKSLPFANLEREGDLEIGWGNVNLKLLIINNSSKISSSQTSTAN